MLSSNLAAGSGAVSVSGSNLTWVVVVGVIALLALAVAALLVREVLAASQGTERMQEIAKSIQEGAAAEMTVCSCGQEILRQTLRALISITDEYVLFVQYAVFG